MYYHAVFYIGSQQHWWAGYSVNKIIDEVLVPFVGKQVVTVNYDKGKAVLNLGAASYLRFYKTEKELDLKPGTNFPERGVTECTQELIDHARLDRSTASAESILQAQLSQLRHQMFVVMKFGDKHLDSAYQGVVKPVASEHGFECVRIDEVQDSGNITQQVLQEIARSEIVLVDLTGERPNTYYEAGFAHALGKELILAVKKDTPIHFDLAGYRFIVWETENELRNGLRERLTAISRRSGTSK